MYTDGNNYRVLVAGTKMTGNHAREGGGAIFYVSNDRSGVLEIRSSTLQDNPSDGFETDPGIFFLGRHQTVVELGREMTQAQCARDRRPFPRLLRRLGGGGGCLDGSAVRCDLGGP